MAGKVFLKERKARPFWFGHPWVFSGAVDRVRGKLKDGELVTLCDHRGKEIGEGFYNSRSQIRVRLIALTHEGSLDSAFLCRRLEAAIAQREEILRLPEQSNAYRVVHSEGDGLPGLIVDRVGDYLVLQVSALGLVPHLEALLEVLIARYAPKGILEKVSKVGAEEEGLQREAGVLHGTAPEDLVAVEEVGQRYWADLAGGQKTGWYSDQRDNRVRLAPLAAGRTVLDAFSYTGGFGLRMAAAGAEHVTLLDSSEPALKCAERVLEEGHPAKDRVELLQGNVLRVLDHESKTERRFGMVVLDPPKFVHRMGDLRKGMRLYHEVNQKGVRVCEPGGLLATFSCSQHVRDTEFDEMLGSVAKEEGVRLQQLARLDQGPDHPALLPLEESIYLTGRLLRVHRERAD